jgi:hypothetical protein
MRSLATSGQRMYLTGASRPRVSKAPTCVAACSEKPVSATHGGADISTPRQPGKGISKGFLRAGLAGGKPETEAAASVGSRAARSSLTMRVSPSTSTTPAAGFVLAPLA